MYAVIIIPLMTEFSRWGDHTRPLRSTPRDMGNRLALKIHGRKNGDIKPRGHIFILKVGTEDHIMEFLRRCVRGKN